MSVKQYDPYKTFRFQIKIDGKIVAGINKVSELKRTTGVNKYRDGSGKEVKTPGNTTIEAMTLERGITLDKQFADWADVVFSSKDPLEKEGYKKDISLELMDNQGNVVHRYFLRRCWVSEFTTMPALDADANTIAIEKIKLELEGYERDG